MYIPFWADDLALDIHNLHRANLEALKVISALEKKQAALLLYLGLVAFVDPQPLTSPHGVKYVIGPAKDEDTDIPKES